MRFSTTLPAALSFIGTVTADFWACDIQPGIQIFPADVRLESVSNQTLTCSHSFDAPKVLPVGDTSYDWWYFDAVADDGIQSLVVVFMQKGENSDFPGPAFTAYVQITGTLSNGTAFTETIPVDQGIVSTSGFGSNGLWGNSNLSWVGTPDLSEYQVRLDAADGTITGLFTLQSVRGITFAHHCQAANPIIDCSTTWPFWVRWARTVSRVDARGRMGCFYS